MENENKMHDCCMKKGHAENSSLHKYALVIMVAALLLMSIVQSFQINSLKNIKPGANSITANAAAGINMAGWTEDEKMMYEHHGVLPSRAQAQSSPSNGMVGGC